MVCCCFPCATCRDAEELDKSGIGCMILSCIFPCLAVYFLRKAAREKYDIDVNTLHSFQTVKIIFVLLNRETSLGMPLVLAVVHFVFNAKLELKSTNGKGV